MALTVGPANMAEDERKIAKGYQPLVSLLYVAGPVVALQFFGTTEVAFVCAGLALMNLHEIGGRLHDLCIRHRRTNLLLREELEAKASRAFLERLDALD